MQKCTDDCFNTEEETFGDILPPSKVNLHGRHYEDIMKYWQDQLSGHTRKINAYF